MLVDNSPGVLSQPVGCEQTKRLLGSFHPHCKLYEIPGRERNTQDATLDTC